MSNLSKTGKTFSIDFMIGNVGYLGKGLGALTLEAFTNFINKDIDRSVDTFFIDPAQDNPRAMRVYEKAGFKAIGSFQKDFDQLKDVDHILMIKKIAYRR